jgi:hypothetical protein
MAAPADTEPPRAVPMPTCRPARLSPGSRPSCQGVAERVARRGRNAVPTSVILDPSNRVSPLLPALASRYPPDGPGTEARCVDDPRNRSSTAGSR